MQVRMHTLEKWKGQMGIEFQYREQHRRRGERAGELPKELLRSAQALAATSLELEGVVPEADRAERDHHKQRNPDVGIARIGKQNRRGEAGSQDQQSAHGGRARLLLMRLR